MRFELKPYHRNVSDEELIQDLKNVADLLNKTSVTIDEYNEYGKYHATTLTRRFGNWMKSLGKAGLAETRTIGVTDEQYFKNIEEVWIKLGRQPRYSEMQKPVSRYSAGAYDYRFGSWSKALERFVDYVNSESIDVNESPTETVNDDTTFKYKTKKSISWRLRFQIMRRDSFKCKFCGRSPATDLGVELHVDHIKPWSKGGETIPNNLQTLCSQCNIGKSNLDP